MLEVVFYIFLKLYQFSFWKTSFSLAAKHFLNVSFRSPFPASKIETWSDLFVARCSTWKIRGS